MILVVLMLIGRTGRRRHVGIVTMNVRTERSGNNSGRNGLLGETIGEMAAVTDIDFQSTIERCPNHGVHFTVTVDEAAGMAREGGSEHAPLPKQRNHPPKNRMHVSAFVPALGHPQELT